jgi:hypothetical protein
VKIFINIFTEIMNLSFLAILKKLSVRVSGHTYPQKEINSREGSPGRGEGTVGWQPRPDKHRLGQPPIIKIIPNPPSPAKWGEGEI